MVLLSLKIFIIPPVIYYFKNIKLLFVLYNHQSDNPATNNVLVTINTHSSIIEIYFYVIRHIIIW